MDEEITEMPSTQATINSISINGTDYPIEDTVARKRAEEGLSDEVVLDKFYPVGSIYQSFEPTSPSELFGGTWTQLTNVFLRAGSNTETGGSDSVTLTTSQMPSHTHGIQMYKSTNEVPNGNHGLASGTSVAFGNRCIVYTASGGGGMNTLERGGAESFDNMPAYQNIYVWRRIA